ncbi:MAG: DUF402 domain-containing protein [Streptosporangiaceae bacterium]
MAHDVRVVYRKHDGALHWNMSARWLGTDEHGTWVGCAAPFRMRRGYEPPTLFRYSTVMLFPRDAWWTAAFNAEPADTEIYCDITTPVRWPTEDEVTMVDLDLDVCRMRDGSVLLLDADEFAEHQVRYGYPADVIAAAESAAGFLQSALSDNAEPFGQVYRSYLDQLDVDTARNG